MTLTSDKLSLTLNYSVWRTHAASAASALTNIFQTQTWKQVRVSPTNKSLLPINPEPGWINRKMGIKPLPASSPPPPPANLPKNSEKKLDLLQFALKELLRTASRQRQCCWGVLGGQSLSRHFLGCKSSDLQSQWVPCWLYCRSIDFYFLFCFCYCFSIFSPHNP